MKKSLLIVAALVLIGMALSSCGSSKPPCPAYRTQVDIEQPADRL